MKKIVLLGVVIIGLVACKKGSPVSPGISGNLFGAWEVSRIYGGNIYPPDSTYKRGNGNIVQFNSDSTFAYYSHGGVINSGVYHIRKNTSSVFTTFNNVIYFNADTSFKSLISLAGDKLTIKPLLPDIATTEYQKYYLLK